MSLGGRVFIMNAGRIVQQGTPDAIYGRPESRSAAEFMGRSNWFTGRRSGETEFATDCGRRLVILPQAPCIAVPPTVGFLVQLVKSMALTSIIGFDELLKTSNAINNAAFAPFTVYGLVALICFALCYPLTIASRKPERRLALVT